ncbi:MAG TPA: hypothetical protein PK977_02960 [Chitinophagaceae bacterium]|nr:hypothetical protein [Chitinophagaceae bacterium]
MKKPIVMIVETRLSSLIQSFTNKDKVSKKNKPQMKASRDKNKSQRIGILV